MSFRHRPFGDPGCGRVRPWYASLASCVLPLGPAGGRCHPRPRDGGRGFRFLAITAARSL